MKYSIYAIRFNWLIGQLPCIMSRTTIFDQKGIEAFAEHFKIVRKKYGFTQESLAYDSDIALSQIARLETAKINPSLSTIFKLARTMDVPLQELFDFKLP